MVPTEVFAQYQGATGLVLVSWEGKEVRDGGVVASNLYVGCEAVAHEASGQMRRTARHPRANEADVRMAQ